jgi:hypothetical protein
VSVTQLVEARLKCLYNDALDNPVCIQVDGQWYSCRVRNLLDIAALLSVHPVVDGKINVRYDTGRCGAQTYAADVRPASIHLAAAGAVWIPEPESHISLRLIWDPNVHSDGRRLFFGECMVDPSSC